MTSHPLCSAMDQTSPCRNDAYRSGLCHAHWQLACIERKRARNAARRQARNHSAPDRSAMIVRNVDALAALTGHDGTISELAALNRHVHAATQRAVEHARSAEGGAHSWAQIGAMLGITPQAAQQRFGRHTLTGAMPARKAGGQPAQLR